jgi:hypothetical protein
MGSTWGWNMNGFDLSRIAAVGLNDDAMLANGSKPVRPCKRDSSVYRPPEFAAAANFDVTELLSNDEYGFLC